MTDLISRQVNLHAHTEESALDGFARPEEAATHAASMGQQALAINDHGECSGHLRHKKACEAAGIHPVYGMEGYWVEDIAAFREYMKPSNKSQRRYPDSIIGENNSHICLLAKNQTGLSNLWAWSSQAYEPSHHYNKPLADPALMRQYAEGLYGSDGCMLTDFARAVERSDEDRCREIFSLLLDVFGDHFYSELHTWQLLDPQTERDHQLNAIMTHTNQMKVRLATEMGVPLVVVNDSHYAQRQDWEYHRMTWSFNTSKNDDQHDARGQAADWMMNETELHHYMARHGIGADVVTEAITNSYDIAMSCQVDIVPTMTMPRLTSSDAEDVAMFLDAVESGYKRKIVARGLDEDDYFPRLEAECRLIVDKGFAGYFNVTQDLVRSVRDGSYIRWTQGNVAPTPRLCGPGRGSAGGSLVTYLMDITALDPIKYGLLFERFLTEDRPDWPDVDTDVPQSARPFAKSYIHARHDHTCAIGTRSRSRAAQTLKDLREPLNIPWADVTEIGKVLDQLKDLVDTTGDEEMDEANLANLTWDEIIELKGGDLAPYAKKHPGLFENMRRMTNRVRQTSVHAAGVLIGNQSFSGRCPTRVKNGTRTTQFDMHEVEFLGAVKMDVLGIRHLDTLEQARDLVFARHGIWLDYDSTEFGTPPSGVERVIQFDDAQYSDPAIWEQIDLGDTLGVFQLETPLATEAAMNFTPRSERDVCDLISVNRPGVINAGQLPHYLARREGSEKVVYDHPLMEAVTGPGWRADTYGILVYQEQMMRAAEVLADFNPAERERLRKMIGKKQMDKMIALEGEFIARCLANPAFTAPFAGSKAPADRARTVAEKIWRSLLASGSYAFNRCISGDTQVKLSATSQHSNGTMSVGDMWRRLYDLAPAGSAKAGDPCRYCGRPAKAKARGRCGACKSWVDKFKSDHPRRGLRAWSLGEDGRLRPNRIVDVHHNGEAPVWKVTLADGKSITSTINHKHMTPQGWTATGDLAVGDELLVCGDYEVHGYVAEEQRTTVGERCGPGQRIDGGFTKLREWTEITEKACSEPGCTRSAARGDRIERAHLDGNRRNNDASNLAMKCVSHHKAHDYRANGRQVRGGKGYPAVPVRVVSIEFAGMEQVFDLEMADPSHSWVGNGIVTHNSHAMGYALVATWEIWTKHYFYPELITALLRTDPKKTTRYIRSARRRGIKVLPPDINASEAKFTLCSTDIRYGLDAIAKVGPAAVADIAAQAPYVSFADFVERTSCNSAVVINLVSIGAFDAFGRREDLLAYYQRWRIMDARKGESVLVGGHRVAKEALTEAQIDEVVAAALATPQCDRQGTVVGPSKWAIDIPDFSDEKVVMDIEQRLVGNFITVDPMYRYLDMIETHCVQRVAELKAKPKGALVAVGGVITKIKELPATAKRGPMAFVGVTWGDEEFDVTVFTETWAQQKPYLHLDAPVVLNCIRDARGLHLTSVIRLDWALDGR